MVKVYLTCGGSPLLSQIQRAVKAFVILFFLSSGVAHGIPSPSGHISDGVLSGSSRGAALLVARPPDPPEGTFETTHAPVMYVIMWPPVPTQIERIRQEAYLQLMQQVRQQTAEISAKPTPTWHYVLPAIGAILLLMAASWERWKVLN